MPWVYRSEKYYNETVDQSVVHGLGREYTDFMIPEGAASKPFPSADYADQYSDSLYVIPRLDNFPDPLQEYYQQVLAMKNPEPEKDSK